MLNYIPVFGWIIDFIFKASLAVPFWFIWTFCGIGKRYFYFAPDAYQSIPFLHCVGLFIVIPIAYTIVIPKFVSVDQTNNNKNEKEPEEKDTPARERK